MRRMYQCNCKPIDTKTSIPEGCVCDITAWGCSGNITPICDLFEGNTEIGYEDICTKCEHDRGCHKPIKKEKICDFGIDIK